MQNRYQFLQVTSKFSQFLLAFLKITEQAQLNHSLR